MLFLPIVEPTRCCERIPERKYTTCTMEHYPLAERHMSWIGTSPLLASNSTKHAEVLGRRLRVRSSSFIIRYLASPVVEPVNKANGRELIIIRPAFFLKNGGGSKEAPLPRRPNTVGADPNSHRRSETAT